MIDASAAGDLMRHAEEKDLDVASTLDEIDGLIRNKASAGHDVAGYSWDQGLSDVQKSLILGRLAISGYRLDDRGNVLWIHWKTQPRRASS